MKPYVSIIVPAYNEASRIVKTLSRIREYLDRQNYSYEVLVVIDGAEDKTYELVSGLEQDWSGLRVINNAENRGKGFAVRQGMLAAAGEIRVFTDADNSTDIAHLEKMLPEFEKGCEVVIGSRDPKDAVGARQAVSQSGFKRLLGNLGNLFIQLMVLPGIWDTQAGFKGFTVKAAQKIFSKASIDRWGFDVEAVALARKFGYKIAKIPVYWKNDAQSHVKLSGYIGALLETIRVRWNLWTGKYN